MVKIIAGMVAILAVCLVAFFTITALTTESTVSKTQAVVTLVKMNSHQACLGASDRTIRQLKIDYAIYHADYVAGQAPGPGAPSRAQEATAIINEMKLIAADRISYTSAHELPAPISTIIYKTKFVCPPA